MNNDFMLGDSFRSIVGRLQKENNTMMQMYKNAVALLFISAVLNCLLLAGWIWEIASK